jgi:hypothetical protein
MRDLFYALRFFCMVAPVPRLMVQAMVVVGALAAVLVVLDRERSARALMPLLLLQLFAASSGFMVPARRGHYDLLLTSGYGRLYVAAVHWVASTLPGVMVWLAVTVVDVALAPASVSGYDRSGTAVAMILVSTVPWAATVGLPRFTAAIAWLLFAVVVAVVLPAGEAPLLLDPLPASSWASAFIATTLNPAGLIGLDVWAMPAAMIAPAATLSAGSMIAAFTWIRRRDIPLEAAQ